MGKLKDLLKRRKKAQKGRKEDAENCKRTQKIHGNLQKLTKKFKI